MSVYSALRFWGISYGWAGLGASALLTFYGLVTGFGASVFRAVFMVEASCLAAYLGRSYDLLSALSLSLILQAWQSPYLLFSAGLQLSYGAVAAIGLETERLRLRRFTAEDAAAILAIFGDVEANTFLPWFPLKSLEEARQLFERQ